MESCTRIGMIFMSVLIIGIFSIEESEGFFLKNLLPEAQPNEEHIPLSAFNQGNLISNTTHIIVDEIHRNVSETLEESSTQIINSVKDIVHHTVNTLKTSNLPEESRQIDVDLKHNEIPSTEGIITLVEHHESSDPALSIVKLPEEKDSQDVVTVLEDNIRSSVKDEIQLVQNFESSAIDVIDDIPDAEVRQTLTEDLMAIEYPQSVKNLKEIESTSTLAASVTQDNASLSDDITTVPTTASAVTSVGPSEIESTTTNSMLLEETTTFATELEDIQNIEILNEPREILTRQMRGFDEESESAKSSNQSSDLSENSYSSSRISVNDLLESESSTKDENVGAEETSEELDEVISQDASVEGGFQKEDITMQQTILPKVSPTPRPYISSTTETLVTVTTEITTSQILIEPITESIADELNEVSETNGDANHVVVKKPAVEEDYLFSDAEIILTNTDAPLDDEDKDIVNSTGKVDQIDITAEEHTVPNAEDNKTSSSSTEDFHIVNENEHNALVDAVTPQSNSNSVGNFPHGHNEQQQLPEVSQNIAEVVDVSEDLIFHAPSSVSNSHTTAPTLEHLAKENIIEEIDDVPNKHEVHTHTSAANLDQQLPSSQESTNDRETTNQMQLTEPNSQNTLEISTESAMSRGNVNLDHEYLSHSSGNAIFKEIDEVLPIPTPIEEQNIEPVAFEGSSERPFTPSNADRNIQLETSTEKPSGRSNEDEITPALVYTIIEAAELTTEFARHVDSFRAVRDETAAISDEIISTAAAGRSFNAIVAEGLGKPLPTRSVDDEPSTSSYSSEDKTTTVVVLCSSAAIIFIAFSVAMYLITFQRQHGTLDIEMQEQQCGKDDLEEEEDAETRVTLLNHNPQGDSDAHSFE